MDSPASAAELKISQGGGALSSVLTPASATLLGNFPGFNLFPGALSLLRMGRKDMQKSVVFI